MKIVDANVLLYAVNADAEHHAASRDWLDDALGGSDTVGFSWVVMLAFLRLSTKRGLFPRPLTVGTASRTLDRWTAAPGALIVTPGPDHVAHLDRLLGAVGVGGNLVNDAHLAAIAIEQRAEIVSYDQDFTLFPGVRLRRPGQLG